MTLDEMRAECDRSEAHGCEAIILVLDRPAGGGKWMRLAPGLMGELLSENCDRKVVVRILIRDVRRFIARAEAAR